MSDRIVVYRRKLVLRIGRIFITFISLMSILYFASAFSYASYATPEMVSDEEASEQGYKIITYCYESLQNNYFEPGYSLKHCDESMIYFNEYCHERAFYPVDHVCTDNEVVGALNTYIEVRGLEGYHGSGYYPIEFTEDTNA
jgi:hypothetical protein